MPDAVTPPVENLPELALPYLRTPADLQYVQASDAQQRDAVAAAASYYHEADAVVTPSGFRISVDARGAGFTSQTERAPPPMAAAGNPPEG